MGAFLCVFFSPPFCSSLTPSSSPSSSRPHRGRVRSELTCNLWTGILLTAATVPLVVLYLLWLTATCAGWIKGREPETQVERLVRHLSSPAEADHASDPLAERAVPIETAWLEANKPGSFAPV